MTVLDWDPCPTMVILALCMELRCSELCWASALKLKLVKSVKYLAERVGLELLKYVVSTKYGNGWHKNRS